MRRLMISTTILTLLLLSWLHVAQATGVPMSAQWAGYLLDHLPSGPDYRDQQVYSTTQAQLQAKIDEAAKFPDRAEAIAREIYADMIKYSPMDPGYTPEGNARTAAAFEAYIKILNSLDGGHNAAPAAAPQQDPSTITGLPSFSDPDASSAVNQLLNGTDPLSFLDSFFPPVNGNPDNSESTITCETCGGLDQSTQTNVSAPTVQTPQVSISVPNVQTPQVGISVPTVQTPQVSISAPTVRTPSVGISPPSIRAPQVNVSAPTVQTPQINGVSQNYQSTITCSTCDVSSQYQPITQDAAQNIVGKYKSVPGGVTLEGDSLDLSFIKTAKYLPQANAFILNGGLVYLNPVSADEFLEIYNAIMDDDRIGVSMGQGIAIIFGKLSPQGPVATNLELADLFLGDIAFGAHRLTRGYNFASGYAPQALKVALSIAVYFNLHGYHFAAQTDGQLIRSGVNLDSTLVPLATQKNSEGGHLPDLQKISKGDFPPEYVANLKHLQENISYYAREKIVRVAISYGEVATFARALKSNGVALDLASLRSARPATVVSASTPLAAPVDGDCALAADHWRSAESIGTRVVYEDHLARFPNCAFATLARARIAALTDRGTSKGSDEIKTCAAGFVRDSDGDCVRNKGEKRRAVTGHAAPQSGQPTDIISNGLNCARTTDLVTCANRAISTLPLTNRN